MIVNYKRTDSVKKIMSLKKKMNSYQPDPCIMASNEYDIAVVVAHIIESPHLNDNTVLSLMSVLSRMEKIIDQLDKKYLP